MASIIRVKRSTGSSAPGSLKYGELAYTLTNGTQANAGQRFFVGDSSENPKMIGGQYYTDMMSLAPGQVAGRDNPTTPANGFIPILNTENSGNPGGGGNVNRLPRVDQWSVDNLTFDGNTIYSNNTDGDIIFDTNGAGQVIIQDDIKLTFGTSEDSSIEYDEDSSDKVQVTGAGWVFNNTVEFKTGGGGGTGGIVIDNVGIASNVISTKSGAGNQLFIDPYPDGLSNEGTVIVKGDLQVDGTTTTVNSTNVTSNEAIFRLGDVTSTRTVLATVGSGTSAITLDSVVGINTGDTLSTSGISGTGTTTVHSYNAGSKIVYIDGTTTAGIATETQITVVHAYDTNTDRGISFQYNTSSGTANNKTGFYGYIDTDSNGASSAPAGCWTYIPDATISNSAVTGVRGYLDIKGLYYQDAESKTHGVTYFDSSGLLTSTDTPANATTTSSQVMTAVTEIVLTLDGTTSFAAGDQVSQPAGGTQYGVVKTSTSSSNSVTLIGVDGTFNTSNPIFKNNATTSRTPSNVSTTYTSKPMWTTTIDGGTF